MTYDEKQEVMALLEGRYEYVHCPLWEDRATVVIEGTFTPAELRKIAAWVDRRWAGEVGSKTDNA